MGPEPSFSNSVKSRVTKKSKVGDGAAKAVTTKAITRETWNSFSSKQRFDYHIRRWLRTKKANVDTKSKNSMAPKANNDNVAVDQRNTHDKNTSSVAPESFDGQQSCASSSGNLVQDLQFVVPDPNTGELVSLSADIMDDENIDLLCNTILGTDATTSTQE